MDEVYLALKRFVESVTAAGMASRAILGTVTSLNADGISCVVEPLNGDADISDARFISDPKGKTSFVPKVGSIVVVQLYSQSSGVIIGFAEVGSIALNGTDKGGLVTVVSLLQKINQLEQQINSLKTIFATWVPVPNDGGLALKSLTTNFSAQQIALTQKAEIENESIKHGTGI